MTGREDRARRQAETCPTSLRSPEPVPVSAHAGGGQARGHYEYLTEGEAGLILAIRGELRADGQRTIVAFAHPDGAWDVYNGDASADILANAWRPESPPESGETIRKLRNSIFSAVDLICSLKPERARFHLEQTLARLESGSL